MRPELSAISLSALLSLALPFGVSVLILLALLKSGVARNLAMDLPNQRSLHTVAIPRVGGVAIIFATLIAWSLLPERPALLILLTAALAGISFVDDRRGLPVVVRLLAHGAAALLLVLFGLNGSDADVWRVAGLTAYVVFMTNAYNFMDGADGLAGGMALCGFSAYACAALIAAAEPMAGMSFAVAAAAGGFLVFNFPPAKVFMGDAGSIPLGFLAAGLGLLGWRQGLWPLWFPLLVFSPFLADAGVTLLRRIWRGEQFWQAHREHYYQRLIRMGWGHRRTAVAEYLVMAGVAVSAVAALGLGTQAQVLVVVAWLAMIAGIMLAIDRRWQGFLRAAKGAAEHA
ncbi:MAG: glycosyltransferase family 4 protein [Betaproteobacteria bacterium]|nr:glycosyltransferase family 4 protein [Betaproteobacteria bacterium]